MFMSLRTKGMKILSCFFVFLLSCFLTATAFASVTLRVVAVNPSEDSEQSVPIKVYLPVEVKPHEVTIATAEPFDRSWETELKPILRKEIRRVIANPLDIVSSPYSQRYDTTSPSMSYDSEASKW